MKIAVIGGGSTYTPELVNGFLAAVGSLSLKELWLMDIDRERLDIVGGFAQRMVKAKGEPFKVVLSLDQREAIAGASYVITQLHVGQMPARRSDEYFGLRHGLIGQETTGVGGMAKALRTIPVILSIAKDIREVVPGAWLANFTNPQELGWLAVSVAPQIEMENDEVEIIQSGSVFEAGELITNPVRAVLLKYCPKAKLIRLDGQPVVGAVILGMEQARFDGYPVRDTRIKTANEILG